MSKSQICRQRETFLPFVRINKGGQIRKAVPYELEDTIRSADLYGSRFAARLHTTWHLVYSGARREDRRPHFALVANTT